MNPEVILEMAQCIPILINHSVTQPSGKQRARIVPQVNRDSS